MKKLYSTGSIIFLIGLALTMSGCNGVNQVPADEVDRIDHPHLNIETNKGNVSIRVEIADTFEERRKGLMFRTSLPEKEGMYFVFEEPKQLDFWMKNTLIPLDMIFIDKGFHIANIAKNVPPCKADPCPSYSSIRDAQYVLEIGGGQSDALGIKSGNFVQLDT